MGLDSIGLQNCPAEGVWIYSCPMASRVMAQRKESSQREKPALALGQAQARLQFNPTGLPAW